jgi:dolichol-phosphate mannosyltransferase
MTVKNPDISVVIPARDEVIALERLLSEVDEALAGQSFEIVVIDDGSTDGSHHLLSRLSARNPRLRWLRNKTSIGQSASIRRGVRFARAEIIVTLDGDGQNPPDQIPALLAPFNAPGSASLGLVQGQREKRRDTAAKRISSRIANAIRGGLLKDGVRDSGCGLKAFRREAYFDLPWFDHIHRFMPAMMLREGWHVNTVPVSHRERVGGRSKYGNLSRALVGIPDLLGVAWLIRRAGPPRHPPKTAGVETLDMEPADAGKDLGLGAH